MILILGVLIEKKMFYDYFDDPYDPLIGFSLKQDAVSAINFKKGYWLVKIDTTYPAPVHLSTGKYTKKNGP